MPTPFPTTPAAWWGLAAAALVGAGSLAGVASPAAAGGAALTWTLRGGGPLPPLVDPAVAYDPDTSSVVLFGGLQPDGALSSSTWVLSGGTWTQAATGPTGVGGPPAREGAAMAFDAARHQFVLFGGLGADGQALADTWAWNGASWVQLTPTGPVPPVRYDAAMAPDAAGHLVLFGGTTQVTSPAASPTTTTPTTAAPGGPSPHAEDASPTAALGDTWTWDGTSWSPTAQSGPAPTARTAAAVAWDPTLHQTVLFGGSPSTDGSGAPLADTWTWDGAAWSAAAPTTSPPARAAATLVGDPMAGGAVLVGGSSASAPTSGAAADAWAWDGSTWSPLAVAGPLPPGRRQAGGAYDAATGTGVVTGGVDAGGAPVQATAFLAAAPVAVPTPPGTTAPAPAAPGPVATTPTTPGTAPPPTAPSRSGPPTTAQAHPAALSTPGVAAAGPVPPAPVVAPAAPRAVEVLRPGEHLDLLGAGFAPGAVVTTTFHSTPRRIATVRASATGTVAEVVAVPADAPAGLHHFVLTGAGGDGRWATLVTAVRVVAPPGRGPVATQTAALVGLAVGLPLATWAVLAWGSRRRRPATPPPG